RPYTTLFRSFQVVVHKTHCLHEGVDGRRPDETPAAPLQFPGKPCRYVCARIGPQMIQVDDGRPFLGVWLEAPEEGGQRACLVSQFPCPPRIVDGRDDLAAMADNPGIGKQPFYIVIGELRDPVEIEAFEGFAEVLALAQDGQPGQAGLESLQADLLEKPPVVAYRPPPFMVVIVK